MTTSAEAVYLDSSALVKLVVQEAESAELEQYLRAWPRQVSCALARVEVTRAVRPHGPVAVARAQRLLEGVHLLQLDDELLDDAATLDPPSLRGLDALHLAAARTFRGEVTRLVTYDHRLAAAASGLGLAVDAPGT